MLRVIDQMHPPSDPQEIKGREAIAASYDDVCGCTMTHSVDFGIAERDRLASLQNCTYPDRKRVCCSAMLERRNGEVARQVSVQAWDS